MYEYIYVCAVVYIIFVFINGDIFSLESRSKYYNVYFSFSEIEFSPNIPFNERFSRLYI